MKKLFIPLLLVLLTSCGTQYKVKRNILKTRNSINKNLDGFNKEVMDKIESENNVDTLNLF